VVVNGKKISPRNSSLWNLTFQVIFANMMRTLVVLLGILCTVSNAGTLSASPMTVTWQLDSTGTNIIFNLTCQCTGWIGIGLTSTSGNAHIKMDTMVAVVSSGGSATITDGMSNSKTQPTADTNDYTVLGASVTSTTTFVSVKRALTVTDTTNDVAITNSVMGLYYAYLSGSTAISSQHSGRGSAAANLAATCTATPTLVNQDAMKFSGCQLLSSTRKVRFRWNINATTIDGQIEANLSAPGGALSGYVYAVGVRPAKYTGVSFEPQFSIHHSHFFVFSSKQLLQWIMQ
jgi:hypothetical protein